MVSEIITLNGEILEVRNTQLRRHHSDDAAITYATLLQLEELRTDWCLELNSLDKGPALLLTLSWLTEIF